MVQEKLPLYSSVSNIKWFLFLYQRGEGRTYSAGVIIVTFVFCFFGSEIWQFFRIFSKN